MDHYDELVMAHLSSPGGRSWFKSIELEVIHMYLRPKGAPLVDGREVIWFPVDLLERGRIEWDCKSECVECDGTGYVTHFGRRGGSWEIDCPACDGSGDSIEGIADVRIVTDHYGHFEGYAEGYEP